ncbi:MAG: hypothetical protein GY751_16820 [Bacteroidetes bacterium]|nr:hypothetical protein [Bacteroidota bacterium]
MKSVASEKMNMVHYQHVGPIGQYHLPKEPRFRFDEKLRRAVSLDSDIEVVEDKASGFDVTTFKALLRIRGRYYCVRAISETKYDKDGNQIFKYVDGKKAVSDHVWRKVHSSPTFNSEYKGDRLEEYSLTELSDPITSIIFEYLAINKRSKLYDKTFRIIFSEDEPISPKNWEVV